MDIISQIKDEVLRINNEYINSSDDNFNFWEQHIKYVVHEAIQLAEKYNADKEIVELGALLHDVALMSKVGTRSEHHIKGVVISEKLLKKYNYPEERLNRVLGCIKNHRKSQNATNIEELCVADADILAHYDNIPMCFEVAFKFNKIDTTNKEEWIKYFEHDYLDLSDKTKETFKERYLNIIDVLFGNL